MLEQIEQKKAGGQGFVVDPKVRKAIENFSVEKAKQFFTDEGFSKITEVGKPFDLLCEKVSGELLYVEVKGTTTTGETIMLTANEVTFHATHVGKTALFVCSGVQIAMENQQPSAFGGESHVLWPWQIEEQHLKPLIFSYKLPYKLPLKK